MGKKIVSLLLALILLASATGAFALNTQTSREEISVSKYADLSKITPGLSVSGSTATYSLTVRGANNVTSLKATLQIQKKNSNGTYSDSGTAWTASSSSNYLYTSGTKTVASGGTYRLKVTVTPYIGYAKGTAETAYS